MPLKDVKTIMTLKVHLAPENKADFANWQALLNAKLAAYPGFLSLEFISPANESGEWLIVQRFENPENFSSWLECNIYKDLRARLQKIIQGDIVEKSSGMSDVQTGVTEVFVTQVDPAKESEYRKWIARMHELEAQFTGFKGAFVQAPTSGMGKNWLTFLQFDTQDNLDKWLVSDERKKIMEESKHLISSLESHRVYSPFAGWFKGAQDASGGAPPIWKQTMIVLLVLFPIVMLEFKYLNPLTAGLNLSLATFIGNAISVSLVSWPMVPLAIYLLRFWLVPPPEHYVRNTLFGTLLVLILYLIEILIFWR